MIFESCIAGWQVISVGIERNVPIRSSATAVGHKHSNTIHYGQVSELLDLWLLSFQPLDFEARSEMFDSRRK